MDRTISYATPCLYRDHQWNDLNALATLRYGHPDPTTISIDVVCAAESFKLSVVRKAMVIAQHQPVLTHYFAFGHGSLHGAPAVTIAFRHGSSRQLTLNQESLAIFLSRTQLLVPLDQEDQLLRQIEAESGSPL